MAATSEFQTSNGINSQVPVTNDAELAQNYPTLEISENDCQQPATHNSAVSQQVQDQNLPPSSQPASMTGSSTVTPREQVGINVRLQDLKGWSMNTFKCTKQMLSERFGKATRTVDQSIETRVATLRAQQERYRLILSTSLSLQSNFTAVVNNQKTLADLFSEHATTDASLAEEFQYNAESQRVLNQHGDQLVLALQRFTTSLDTLVNRTMEDTLDTVRKYDKARIELDAYRHDMGGMTTASKKYEESKIKFDASQDRYNKLKSDIDIKIQFLDENRVRVMQKQLLLFHNAVSSFFSGNQKSLEACLKQFSIRPRTPNSEVLTFLEADDDDSAAKQ